MYLNEFLICMWFLHYSVLLLHDMDLFILSIYLFSYLKKSALSVGKTSVKLRRGRYIYQYMLSREKI